MRLKSRRFTGTSPPLSVPAGAEKNAASQLSLSDRTVGLVVHDGMDVNFIADEFNEATARWDSQINLCLSRDCQWFRFTARFVCPHSCEIHLSTGREPKAALRRRG